MNDPDLGASTATDTPGGEDARPVPETPEAEGSTRTYYSEVSRKAPGVRYALYLLSSGLLIFPFQFLTSLALGSPVGKAQQAAIESALFFPLLSLPFVASSAKRGGVRRVVIFPGYFTVLLFALDVIVPGYGVWHRLWGFSFTQYHRGIPFVVDGSATVYGAALGVFEFSVALGVLLLMSRALVFSLDKQGAAPKSDGG